MPERTNASVDSRFIGEFVDELIVPNNAAFAQGDVVRPNVIARYVDIWGAEGDLREFTVLLADGRTATVHGDRLRHDLNPVAGEDFFCVLIGSEPTETLVAAFKSRDIQGIFHGDLRVDRKIA